MKKILVINLRSGLDKFPFSQFAHDLNFVPYLCLGRQACRRGRGGPGPGDCVKLLAARAANWHLHPRAGSPQRRLMESRVTARRGPRPVCQCPAVPLRLPSACHRSDTASASLGQTDSEFGLSLRLCRGPGTAAAGVVSWLL